MSDSYEKYENDRLFATLPDDVDGATFVNRCEDAVEVERARGHVVVEFYDGTRLRLLLKHHRDYWKPVWRPLAEKRDDKVVWQAGWVDAEDERRARKLLQRKYEHVVLCLSEGDLINEAERVAQRGYWNDVREAADEIKRAIDAREVEDREALIEHVAEYVDGHQRVIYTSQAKECVMASQHGEYAIEEGLVDASSFKDGIPWSALAYFAFREDVFEDLMGRLEVDVNDDDLGRTKDEDAE